jgi:hypothetical protein
MIQSENIYNKNKSDGSWRKISNLLQNNYFILNYRTSFTLQIFKMEQTVV